MVGESGALGPSHVSAKICSPPVEKAIDSMTQIGQVHEPNLELDSSKKEPVIHCWVPICFRLRCLSHPVKYGSSI